MSKPIYQYSPEENLIPGIGHTCYEYNGLLSAAYWSLKGSAPWRTHADNAFLIGCRKMHDFLMRNNRSTLQGNELPDILAVDYLPTGFKRDWELPMWTCEWRNQMNRQLAHLSYVRDKSWNHEIWVPPLVAEFRTAWALFLKAVDVPFKAEFTKQAAHWGGCQGFDLR